MNSFTPKTFTNVPDALKQRKQWILWKYEKAKGKDTKVPYTLKNVRARVNDAATWTDFESAVRAFMVGIHKFSGLGFVFSANDEFFGIDLDKCRDSQTGAVDPGAVAIMDRFSTYTELSVSGAGVHVIGIGKKPGEQCKVAHTFGTVSGAIEVYDSARWFVVTGDVLDDYAQIRDCQSELTEFYNELFKPKATTPAVETSGSVVSVLDDAEIIRLASTASNGAKFRQLYDGDYAEYPSQSEADEALCSLLAFYTTDYDQILRIIKNSKLWDEKWERPDYQKRTISRALETVTARYAPPARANVSRETQARTRRNTDAVSLAAPKFQVEKYLPQTGLLRDYVDYMLPITEAPAQYHFFAGLILLATAIGQRIFFRTVDEKKYCNLWVALVGDSGCKKSTSITKPQQILTNSGHKDSVLPIQLTSEKLIPMLATRSIGTFFWSEWGATMDQWHKMYCYDLMSIFCNLFDGGYFSRWLRNEKYEIQSSAINLFCGCTPAWLKKTLADIDIAQGFWPRFLFVPAAKRDRYLSMPPTGDQSLKERVCDAIDTIQSRFSTNDQQEIDFSNVYDMYDRWYKDINSKADSDVRSFISSFVVRLADYVKKIAALIELSTTCTVCVSVETMQRTLALIDWLEAAIISVVSDVVASEFMAIESRVYKFIAEASGGSVIHSYLRQQLSQYSKSEIDLAVLSLEDAGRIRVDTIPSTSKGGRPGKRYTALEVEVF